MQEPRRLGPAQQASQADLSPGRRQQVLAPDHVRDRLRRVVGHRRKLIRPVAEPIADEQVATLRRRLLRLRAETGIHEAFDARRHPHPPPDPIDQGQAAIPAGARIAPFAVRSRLDALQVGPRAGATVDEAGSDQARERLAIHRLTSALPDHRPVRREAQPGEILEEGLCIRRTASLAVVVLDTHDHAPAGRPRGFPHAERAHHVPEVQIPGGRRCEAGQERERVGHGQARRSEEGKRRP